MRKTGPAIVLSVLALAGCSSGDSTETEAAAPAASTAAEDPSSSASAPAESSAPAEQPAAPAGVGDSRATLTVNGETWEFVPFLCAVGSEQTRSETYSFSSDAQAAGEGDVVVQFQISARDDTGQNRLLGDGVVYEFTLYDFGSDTPTIEYDGETTDGVTIGPGTLQVDAEFTSISGESYMVVVDAVCLS